MPIRETSADVPCGDEHGGGHLRVVRHGRRGHVSAHAVADDEDAMRIDAVLLRVRGIEDKLHLGVGVFGGMLKGETAFDTP